MNMEEQIRENQKILRMLRRPEGQIDVVLDTDTYNEIDDQFALVYALLTPECINLLPGCALWGSTPLPFMPRNSTTNRKTRRMAWKKAMKRYFVCSGSWKGKI